MLCSRFCSVLLLVEIFNLLNYNLTHYQRGRQDNGGYVCVRDLGSNWPRLTIHSSREAPWHFRLSLFILFLWVCCWESGLICNRLMIRGSRGTQAPYCTGIYTFAFISFGLSSPSTMNMSRVWRTVRNGSLSPGSLPHFPSYNEWWFPNVFVVWLKLALYFDSLRPWYRSLSYSGSIKWLPRLFTILAPEHYGQPRP